MHISRGLLQNNLQVVALAEEVRELFRTLIRLHVRKGTIKVTPPAALNFTPL